MNVEVTSASLSGGYGCYCDRCDLLFSVSTDKPRNIKYCPVCGWDTIVNNPTEVEKDYPVEILQEA